VWTMEALLSYGVPHDFHARLDSERSTLLRRPFIHAIEGHHRIFLLLKNASNTKRTN
jgi:hypothetical protein